MLLPLSMISYRVLKCITIMSQMFSSRVWTYFQNICYHVFLLRTVFDEFGRKPVNKSSLIAKMVKTMLSNRMKAQKEKDQSNNANWFQVGNWLFNSYYRVQKPNLENLKVWCIISNSKLGGLTIYFISYMAFIIFFFISAIIEWEW